MTERSIMGIPVNPCINGITKAQAAKINEIDGIKADIIDIESQLGNSGKEWLKLPYENYSEFQPYIEKILDLESYYTKYDIIIRYNFDGSIVYIPKNTDTANSNLEITKCFYSDTLTAFGDAGTYVYTLIFYSSEIIETSELTISGYEIYFGVKDSDSSIVKNNLEIPEYRNNFEIYVFAADLENL